MTVHKILDGESVVGRYDDIRGAAELDGDFSRSFVDSCGSWSVPAAIWEEVGRRLSLHFVGVRATRQGAFDPSENVDGALIYSAAWIGFSAHAHDSYSCNDRRSRAKPRETHLAASIMTVRRDFGPGGLSGEYLLGAEREAAEVAFGRGRLVARQEKLL